MRHPPRLARISAVLSALLLSSTAQAQMVFLARKAAGKVRAMSQQEKTGAPGYSVAEVVVPGDARRAYAAAVDATRSSTEARLTHEDPERLSLEFEARGQVFGLRISQVDSRIVHILIATTTTPGQPDATGAVVDATLRVCERLKASCQVAR